MSQFSRHDLKKNELAEIIGKAVEYIRNNRNLVYGVSATILGIVLLGVFFAVRMNTLKGRGEEKLAVAQGLISQGQPDQGFALLNELISSYSSGAIADQARMAKADFLVNRRNYLEAEQAMLPVAQNGRPKKIIPLALASLGAIQESAGKFQEAIATYNKFLEKYSDNFLAPKVLESLARVYEITGAADQARTTYERITTMYPGSQWFVHAQERLATFPAAQQPQQPSLNLK